MHAQWHKSDRPRLLVGHVAIILLGNYSIVHTNILYISVLCVYKNFELKVGL